MVQLSMLQILILSLYAGVSMIDGLTFQFGTMGIIQSGIFAGLVVGDPKIGLVVGGVLQSYALGIGTYGGASIPNYAVAAILVTALAGGNMESAEGLITMIGVPIAALTVQFDVLGRFTNTVFQRLADKDIHQGRSDRITLFNTLGTIPWGLSRAIPVFLGLYFGGPFVNALVETIPAWITSGFIIAGKLLPAVGFTILLKYLPTRTNISYLILGFVLAAYLGLGPLPVALIGLAIAIIIFKNATTAKATVNTASYDDGGDEYDE